MTNKQLRLAGFKRRLHIAQEIRGGLALALAFLGAALLVLGFGIGRSFWPAWMVEYHTALTGMAVGAFAFLTLMSPLVVEASVNPRTLHTLAHYRYHYR